MRPVYETGEAGVKTVNNRHQTRAVFEIFKCLEELSKRTADSRQGLKIVTIKTSRFYLVLFFLCIISFAKGGRKKKGEEGKKETFSISPNFSLSTRPSYHHTFQKTIEGIKAKALTPKNKQTTTNKTSTSSSPPKCSAFFLSNSRDIALTGITLGGIFHFVFLWE